MSPSAAYMEAARAAQEWIRERTATKCRLCERKADAEGLCSVCSGQIDVVM